MREREGEREEARLGEERKRRKNETRRNRARERKSGDGSTVIRVTNFPLTPFASLCSTVWTRLIINTHIRFWKTRLGVSGWETFFFFLNPPHNGYLLFLAVSKLELLSKTSFSIFSPSDSWIFFSIIDSIDFQGDDSSFLVKCWGEGDGFWFCTSLELWMYTIFRHCYIRIFIIRVINYFHREVIRF